MVPECLRLSVNSFFFRWKSFASMSSALASISASDCCLTNDRILFVLFLDWQLAKKLKNNEQAMLFGIDSGFCVIGFQEAQSDSWPLTFETRSSRILLK
jgi:hypothetical protein